MREIVWCWKGRMVMEKRCWKGRMDYGVKVLEGALWSEGDIVLEHIL